MTLILILIVFLCVLLVLVILAQNSKGGGLTSEFGGSSASNMIGVKKTGDLLEKLTWGFILSIFLLSISANFIPKSDEDATDEFVKRAQEQQSPASNSLDLDDFENSDSTQNNSEDKTIDDSLKNNSK